MIMTHPTPGARRRTLAALILGVVGLGAIDLPARAQTSSPTQAQPAAPAPAPVPVPVRTESQVHGSWKSTCNEFADPKTPRQCIIGMEARANPGNKVVFAWTIGLDKDGNLVSRMVTLPGVAIPPGVDLKIGGNAVRKLMFSTCEPTYCTLETPIDATFRKELSVSDRATVVIHGSAGKNMNIELSIGGGDKALAVLKK